jgi:23S rRNA (pseudouridine1915-N3)-methyltransferase
MAMHITLLTVGKLKEKYLREALAEYEKRLSRYCNLKILEVADEKTPDTPTPAQKGMILDAEAGRLLSVMPADTYLITLEIKGKELSSEELAEKLADLPLRGKSNLTFVIGGSLGLSEKITGKSDLALSFSRMTFPHQLMRVILLEQIYRAFRINSGGPYHK